jgi:hypothetical protein
MPVYALWALSAISEGYRKYVCAHSQPDLFSDSRQLTSDPLKSELIKHQSDADIMTLYVQPCQLAAHCKPRARVSSVCIASFVACGSEMSIDIHIIIVHAGSDLRASFRGDVERPRALRPPTWHRRGCAGHVRILFPSKLIYHYAFKQAVALRYSPSSVCCIDCFLLPACCHGSLSGIQSCLSKRKKSAGGLTLT